MTLKVMLEDGAFPPSRSFPTDAGLDLYCREEFVLWPRHSHTFDTGVHIRIPPGYYGKVEGRSGLNRDFSVTPTGGVIDETYTGSIGVKLYNFGKEDKVFHPGDRIAQLVIQPCIQPEEGKTVRHQRQTEAEAKLGRVPHLWRHPVREQRTQRKEISALLCVPCGI